MAVMRLKECPQVQDRSLKASGRVLEQDVYKVGLVERPARMAYERTYEA